MNGVDPHNLIQGWTFEDVDSLYANLDTIQEHIQVCPECHTQVVDLGLAASLQRELLERLLKEIAEEDE